LARNPWLAGLLLVMFFAHALIPIGYMPGPGGVILCPGYGPTASAGHADHDDMSGMDMSGTAKPIHHGGKATSNDGMGMCPFAATATTFALGHAPTATAFALVLQAEIKRGAEPSIPHSAVPPTRLPRGPPALV
jgi:hypothetical protein